MSGLFPPSGRYYDEAEVDYVNELLDRGFPIKKIGDRLVEFWGPEYQGTTRNWDWHRTLCNRAKIIASDRWNWCTKQDPMRMELAFMGNKDAWEELNFYERRTVVLRLQHLLDTGERHPYFDGLPIEHGGLSAWAVSVGDIDPQHITSTLGRRGEVRAAKAQSRKRS